MRNFKLTLQYDGTRYNGWQNQKTTGNTIQTKLEGVLSRLTGAAVELSASGRTDAGVHAQGQVANFKSNTDYVCSDLLAQVNQYLPADIAVTAVEEADLRFHARLNAQGKTYCYRIWNSAVPNVFERPYLYPVPQTLNLSAMEQAAALLCGTHDFQSFCSAKPGKKSTVRTLSSVDFQQIGPELRISFTGSGFLYHMVRILTGTLLEVGLGLRDPLGMPDLLAAKNRTLAGPLAPAQGLCLMEVFYPNF